MPVATSTPTWIGFGAAALGALTASLGLLREVRHARRERRASAPTGVPPVEPAPPGDADATGAAPRANVLLPARTSFINRERELQDLLARVRSGQDNVLSIEGSRLVGKSATATELAHSLLAAPTGDGFDPREYTFLWVDARNGTLSLADICRDLALLTGDQALSTTADDRKRDRLRVHLAGRKTVLLLDNLSFADGDEDSAALIDFLRDLPAGSLVIASVNRPGDLVASRVALPDLDVASVSELIEDRVRRFQLDGSDQFDDEFTTRLYELIGGNPGVIEWFLRGYERGAESLEERLSAIERGGALSELFEPVWQMLGSSAQRILEACAYLRGEATASQLAVMCDQSAEEVRAVADRLRREGVLGVVRAGRRPPVYTCSQAFQRFVTPKTAPDEKSAFTRRLFDHYAGHFRRNPEDAAFAVTEIGALRALRDELFEDGDDRLQSLFKAVLDILFTLGQFDELLATAHLAYESAVRADNHAAASLASTIKACTHAIRGEHAAALDAFAHGSLAAERSGQPAEIARQKRCRAFLHYRAREPRAALTAIAGAEELSRAADDHVNLVDTLDLVTAASWYLGEVERCEAAARRSLEASQRAQWNRARAYPVRYLAEISIRSRRYDDARALLGDAHETAAKFGDQRQMARVNLTRARLHLLRGQPELAERAALDAVAEAARLGLPPEREEAQATLDAARRARRSRLWRLYYARRRPSRLTGAPVGGD